jgi:hypothetical protein
MLTRRPDTQLLVIEYRNVISDPLVTAERMNKFLSGGLDTSEDGGRDRPRSPSERRGYFELDVGPGISLRPQTDSKTGSDRVITGPPRAPARE